MYRLRTISYHNNKEPVQGVTIPKDIAIFFQGVSFSIEKSGTSIVLTSGATVQINQKEVEGFDLNSIRV